MPDSLKLVVSVPVPPPTAALIPLDDLALFAGSSLSRLPALDFASRPAQRCTRPPKAHFQRHSPRAPKNGLFPRLELTLSLECQCEEESLP